MNENEQLSHIKKIGEIDNISREEFEYRISEIAKCKRDICYFAEKYFRIISLDKGLHIIRLYEKQKALLRFFVNENRCLTLASRQTGKCVVKDTKITVKNKKTGEIQTIPIETFYNYFNYSKRNIEYTKNCKFIESRDINNYEILTDINWQECTAIHKTVEYKVWRIQTERHLLECADDHIVFRDNMEEVFIKYLKAGDIIMTQDGAEKVTSIQQTETSENMYDVELAENTDHRYYTNGILSHNTTSYTIYALWTLIFNPEKRIMLLANKADTVLEILGRIQMAYEYLPTWLKPAVVVWNKGEIQFSNKSAIKGFPTASDAARGYSAGIVIMDEAAFVPNNIASKVFESIYPVISSSKKSKFIIVSTPNGADPNNLYYSLWQQANQKTAEKNREGWKPFRIDWWDVPGRDQKWKEQTIASIGEKRFAQEFGNEFLTGKQSRKLMPDDVLEKYRMELSKMKAQGIKPVEQQILSEDEQRIYKFKMWREFDASRTYAAAADIAEGVGQDSSVLYIFDVTDLQNITMCAKFSSSEVSLVEFAYVCSKILQLYGSPPLFAERNGVSAGMLDSLRITYKYQNIARESRNGEAGIYSHVTVKGRACLWAREMMTTFGFGFTLPDQDLLDELGSFVKKDTSGRHTVFQAAAGSHDDHVMTLVWLCWGLSKEIIDKYFIVVKSFTSQLGEMLPQILMPLNPYSSLQIKEISQDPVYRRFIEIKNECLSAYNAAVEAERNGEKDVFQWNRQNEPQYFQDEWIGPSWNGGNIAPLQTSVNPNNVMPAFFVG